MVRRLNLPGTGDTGRTRHPAVVVAVLATTGICMSLMQTLVIPLIPELPKLLNTNASNASWAITATLLVAAVATPVFGRLGDMYGPKPMLIACAIVMTAGSLIAASTSASNSANVGPLNYIATPARFPTITLQRARRLA